MIVDCHSCGATYNISDEKVRGRRVRVRCKSCGEGIIVDGASLDAEDRTRVYSPTFDPGAYGEGNDEATRVAPAGAPGRVAYGSERSDDAATRVMSLGSATQPGGGPEDDDGEWTVNVSDTDQRTMSLEQVVEAYESGEITDDAFVWRDGMTDWLPIRDVDDISGALRSGVEETTHVVKPIDLRSAAKRAAIAPPTPVSYAAPAAPPRARVAAPPATTVEYARATPPPARPGPAAARLREGRARGPDLFGDVGTAGGEVEELLRSSSVPLEQYDGKPTGARNESSVLFSLNSLKAGRQGANSAPPRAIAAAPPTAADILGMSAGGAMAGMHATAALLSAPAVAEPPRAPSVPPPRGRFDTTPPTKRERGPWLLILGVTALALAAAGGMFFFVRARRAAEAAEIASRAAPSAPPPVTPAAPPPTPPSPAPAPAAPEPLAPATGLADPAPPPAPVPEAAPAIAPAPPPPAAVGRPAAPPPPPRPGPKPAPAAGDDALKAAMKGGEAEAPPAAEAADKMGAKVVLEEEPAEEAPEEAAAPPFDTGAAKAALEAAAGNAASCKKPDGPTGRGKVQVTFSPNSGRATAANVIEGAFGGTPVGGCVAKIFRTAKVAPFSGDPVTVSKSFSIPE